MTPYSNLNRTFGPQSMSQAVASSELSSFLQAVNNTMGDLIVGQGYSRERATKTILQEIARSVYPSTLNVTDEQVSSLNTGILSLNSLRILSVPDLLFAILIPSRLLKL